MSEGISNLYIAAVMETDGWKIITSTAPNAFGIETKDLLEHLEICAEELDFLRDHLLENISLPLLVTGHRQEEDTAVIIWRGAIFETSICVILELVADQREGVLGSFEQDLEGAVASPLSKKLICNNRTKSVPNSRHLPMLDYARELWTLGNVTFDCRLAAVSAFEDIVSCIKHIVGIDVAIVISESAEYINEDGRILSSGFVILTLLSMAIAAKNYSKDCALRVKISCENGYFTLDITYDEYKKRGWSGCELLMEVCRTYGIPFEIAKDGDTVRCLCIPEYADEAVAGVKADDLYFGYTRINRTGN